MRPDACPGALQVHEAADGALARIRLPGGAVTTSQLRELAACADSLGSGVIELTSRANVQVRGLRSPAAFATRMAAAGLLPSAAHERVRNIVASPLSGREAGGTLDVQPLVEALDAGLCSRPRLAELPGRFLFALDDGTGDTTPLGADVTFAAGAADLASPAGAVGVASTAGTADLSSPAGQGRLLLAGEDTGLVTRADAAVALMLAAAEAFLDERHADAPDGEAAAWRIHELDNGPARITARLGIGAATGAGSGGRVSGPARPRAGRVVQQDGRVALEVLVPLGRLSPGQARALAGCGPVVRLTPWRTAVVLDLSPADADRAERTLTDAGLITDPDSPWAGVTSCTGSPGCAKALADVRADARRWVEDQDRAPGTPVHWAGCERRCGLPRGQVVQMIATGDGYRQETP